MLVLASSVPLTLLSLLAVRGISTGCGSSDLLLRTSLDRAFGLGLRPHRPCGCVGWQLYS